MNETIEQPGLMQKAYRYTRSLSRWIKAGRPVRSEKETSAFFEICKTCRAFDESTDSCRYCGCRLGTNPNPVLNKIAMATERCPVGKWPLDGE